MVHCLFSWPLCWERWDIIQPSPLVSVLFVFSSISQALSVSAYVHNSQPDSPPVSVCHSFSESIFLMPHLTFGCSGLWSSAPCQPPPTHTQQPTRALEPGLRPWEVLGSKRPPSSFLVGRDAEVREKGGVPGPLARWFSSLCPAGRNSVRQLSSFILLSFFQLSDLENALKWGQMPVS